MVLFAAFESTSLLLLEPETGTTQCIDGPEGVMGSGQFDGCTVCPNGDVVFVACTSNTILVAQCPSWTRQMQQAAPEQQALVMMRDLWTNRQFTDAVVEAGEGAVGVIRVHRAVLASRSEVLAKMFSGTFVEAQEARITLPEDVEIVNTVLEYLYTGQLLSGEPEFILSALPLAHRLDLRDCVRACATTASQCDAAQAARILAPYADDMLVQPAWNDLQVRISQDKHLLDLVLRELVQPHVVAETFPSAEHVDASTQVEDSLLDLNPSSDEGDSDEVQGPRNAVLQPGESTHQFELEFASRAGAQLHNDGNSGECCILHFSRWSHKASIAFDAMEVVRSLVAPGVAVRPAWARGAAVLAPGLSVSALDSAGMETSALRQWNVIVLAEDAPRLTQAVRRSMNSTERPRVKLAKTKTFDLPAELMRSMHFTDAGIQNQSITEGCNLARDVNEDSGDSSDFHDAEDNGSDAPPTFDSILVDPMPCPDGEVDSAIMNSPRPLSDVHKDIAQDITAPMRVFDDAVGVGRASAACGAQQLSSLAEEPQMIDAATAAMIQHEQWATAVERRISSTVVDGTPLKVHKSFFHFGSSNEPGSPS